MPNMSRYRVRSKVVQQEVISNGSYMYLSEDDDEEEEGRDLYEDSDSDSEVHVKTGKL